jgi:hypothetical protein
MIDPETDKKIDALYARNRNLLDQALAIVEAAEAAGRDKLTEDEWAEVKRLCKESIAGCDEILLLDPDEMESTEMH